MSDEVLKLRSASAVWREVDGETVLLDLRTSSYLGINETGSILWPALAEGATSDQLVQALVGEFGVSPEQAGSDVEAFLADCRRRELLD